MKQKLPILSASLLLLMAGTACSIAASPESSDVMSVTGSLYDTVWDWFWGFVRVALIILAIILAISLKDAIQLFIGSCIVYCGIGALITYFIFGNGSIGASIGFVLAIIAAIKYAVEELGIGDDIKGLLWWGYWAISLPFYLSNQLQILLSAPWRYLFMRNWVGDRVKPTLRILFRVLTILLNIVITPLRVVNSNYFNGLHFVAEMYDLISEVMVPSSWKEGKGDVWRWILMLPVRMIKYPVFHGALVWIESVIWALIEVVIPSVTLYHGTAQDSSQQIVGSRDRNAATKNNLAWTSGTFCTGHDSWGGIGVYFAMSRRVARSYAYSRGDYQPAFIACRVSLGAVISYALAPDYVYNQAGQYGKHSVLNNFGLQHRYVTGEWWNKRGGYWEYCLFDWKDKYDHPWRIRPIYVFNMSKNIIQHVDGGMTHWLFNL